MLAGSNTSPSSGSPKKREATTSPAISTKLNDYVAEHSLHTPAQRAFKQEGRKQDQTYYHRSLFGGLIGFASLALIGAFVSFYIGYSILASILLCSTVGFAAINVWLNKSIAEVKISPCAAEKPSCKPSVKSELGPQSPNILFRGVSYTIKHEPSDALSTDEKPSSGQKPKT